MKILSLNTITAELEDDDLVFVRKASGFYVKTSEGIYFSIRNPKSKGPFNLIRYEGEESGLGSYFWEPYKSLKLK